MSEYYYLYTHSSFVFVCVWLLLLFALCRCAVYIVAQGRQGRPAHHVVHRAWIPPLDTTGARNHASYALWPRILTPSVDSFSTGVLRTKRYALAKAHFMYTKVQYATPGIRYQVTSKMQRRTCRAKPEDRQKKLDTGSNSKRHISHRKKNKKLSDTSVRQNKPQRQSKLHPQDHTTAASPRPWLK